MNRPCIGCGVLIGAGSRCTNCRPRRPATPGRKGRTATDWRWRKLSQQIRREVRFCETCSATTDLSVDHRLPISQFPQYVYERANLQVLCMPCQRRKGDKFDAADIERVEAEIARRKKRLASYYSQQDHQCS